MKTVQIVSIMLLLFFVQIVNAQNKELVELTNAYYGITGALVSDDANKAKLQAQVFIKSIDAVSKSNMNSSQLKIWQEQKNKLFVESDAISKMSDIAKQREHLNQLSNSLYVVLKAFNGNGSTVYYQYCPMKKTYWLSSDKSIKNPYYGKKMLTCGSVKETLK